VEIRTRILFAFEAAERTRTQREEPLADFRVIGAGLTGVFELGRSRGRAGITLYEQFSSTIQAQPVVLLIEGTDRVCPTFAPVLSGKKEATALGRMALTSRRGRWDECLPPSVDL